MIYPKKITYPISLYWNVNQKLENMENNISEEIILKDMKIKIKKKNDNKIETGGTYYINLNIDSIINNIENFKKLLIINNNSENLLIKTYLNCNLFLFEKEFQRINNNMVVTCTDIRGEYYFCQFKKTFIYNRKEFFQIIFKKTDFTLIGEVLEEKIIYRNI